MLKDGLKNYLFGLLGGFSSLGIYCLYKHFLTRSKIKRIGTTDPRASAVVVHNGLVYTSGQVGEIPKLEESDITEQTKQTLSKIESLLSQAGTDKSRLLEARIWVKDIKNDFAAMNAVWNAWVDPENKGARYCVESNMAREAILVEIQVVATL